MSMPPSHRYIISKLYSITRWYRPKTSRDLLTKIEVERFTQLMENNGGKITYRSTNTDVDEPYEINISLFDAMKETFSKEKNFLLRDIYAYIQS